MQKREKKKKFAVFDIDGTIFRSSLLIELVEELIAQKIFPEKARRIYTGAHEKWLDRKGSYEKYIWKVVQVFDKEIKGVSEKDFLKVVVKVVSLHQHRTYRYTRELIAKLKKEGYYLLAISHSPRYVVGEFAKKMGFDKSYGRLLELDERTRKFTGKGIHLDVIFDKAKVLRRAVEKEGLDLKRSVGVGDTESDIAFLKLVKKPICFNPNSSLYAAAKKYGWDVLVERKDVLYRL